MGWLDWLTGRRGESASGAASIEAPRSDEEAVVAGTRAFALALYRELAGKETGLFFSPSSITAVVAMAAAGARGETAAELGRALRLTLPPERLHPVLAALLAPGRVPAATPKPVSPPPLLPGLGAPVRDDLDSVSSLWVQEGHALRTEYLALVRETYRALLAEVDFERAAEEAREKINAHVAAATHGRIGAIVPPGGVDSRTRLALVNAVYFKRSWLVPFRAGATRDEPFFRLRGGAVKAPLMHQTDRFRLVEEGDLSAIELCYRASSRSMVVLLPKKRGGLPSLERGLDGPRLGGLLARLDARAPRGVVLSLPRFRMEASFSLGDALQALGARRAFDAGQADFSGITADPAGLYVGAVLHRAFVEVNEEGTEAAAATAMLMPMAAQMLPGAPPPVFRADHPFLFLIRDGRGLVSFLGRVLDPIS